MNDENRVSWITGDIFTSSDGAQTLAAWQPYCVTQNVLFSLQNTDVEPRWHGWLIPWVAGLTLLRSTGHVLAKIDSKRSAKHDAVVKHKWDQWHSDRDGHWIFWDFINRERNNVIKEFSFGFAIEPYSESGECEVEDAVHAKIELFREAVYWWRTQLRDIETLLAE